MSSSEKLPDSETDDSSPVRLTHEPPYSFQFPKEKMFQIIVYLAALAVISLLMLVIALLIAL